MYRLAVSSLQFGGTKTLEEITNNLSDRPAGILSIFVDSKIKTDPAKSPCQNAGCSHICLAAMDGDNFQCKCPRGSGLVLNSENSKICIRPSNFLLVGNPSDGSIQISGVEYERNLENFSENFEIITTSPGGVVNALVYDEFDETLYWSDSNMNRIYKKRIFSPGSQIETFIDDRIGSVEGLAIDKETRVLYFTNIHLGENEWENSFFHYGTIEMIGLDTNSESNSETNSESRKIIHSSTRLPRAILVKNRQLLFTDWSSIKPIVYRFVL